MSENTSTDMVVGTDAIIPEDLLILGTEDGAEMKESRPRGAAGARNKFMDDIETAVAAYKKEWQDNSEEGDESKDLALTVISEVMDMVRDLHQNPPKAKVQTGKHYVGVAHDNSRVHFQDQTAPKVSKYGKKFKAVYGPFSRGAGAEYVVKNGVRDTDKKVF